MGSRANFLKKNYKYYAKLNGEGSILVHRSNKGHYATVSGIITIRHNKAVLFNCVAVHGKPLRLYTFYSKLFPEIILYETSITTKKPLMSLPKESQPDLIYAVGTYK